MSRFFQNKTVVVTGASSGIGAELSVQLLRAGANVILCARSENKMKNLVENLEVSPDKYLILPVDFSRTPDFENIVQSIVSKFPKVDILINNAGIAQKSLVQETSEEVERRVMEVNYFANINFTKALLPHFIANKSGQVVGISSILGEIGLPFVAPYCASKHAINGYYNGLRYDVEKHNIAVSIVSPGFIKTDITKKSLTGDGKSHEQDSIAQEKGMEASVCARRILQKVAKKKRQSYVGGLELLMPKFALLFPRFFHFLMKKMHKI